MVFMTLASPCSWSMWCYVVQTALLTGGIWLTGGSELANVKCLLTYGVPLPWVSGRGESSDDTLLVPADDFSSIYAWDQNIRLLVRLHFKCELLVLLRVLSSHPKIRWCIALSLKEGIIKVEGPSRVTRSLPIHQGQIGRSESSL